MKRSEGRILTSHSGSMFPPPQDGAGDRAAYFAATGTETDQVAETVRAVVDKQVEMAFDVINNGDLNRGLTLMHDPPHVRRSGAAAARGVAGQGTSRRGHGGLRRVLQRSPVHALRPGAVRRTGPVSPKGSISSSGTCDAHGAAEGKGFEELFYCVISPGWLRRWIMDEHYGSEEDLRSPWRRP